MRGVSYLFVCGFKHAVVLAVSLYSLRKWWDGPISIFVDDVTKNLGEGMAVACDAKVRHISPEYARRHSGYLIKTTLPALSEYDQTLQLDADTVVTGSFDELWPREEGEVVLTQFADWVTTGRRISGRLEKFKDLLPVDVHRAQTTKFPAVNTGILAYDKVSILANKHWNQETRRAAGRFISDEIIMQAIFPLHDKVRIADDRWNWSPLYGSDRGREDMRIVHHHGKKAVHEASAKYWIPHFQEVWRSNFGGIRNWCPAGDGRLAEYLKLHPEVLE